MRRRIALLAGWFVVASAFAFCTYYWFAERYTNREWSVVSSKVDFSGTEQRMEVLPTHAAEYTLDLTIDVVPPDQNEKIEHWVCRLTSPTTSDEVCASWHYDRGDVNLALIVRDGERIVLSQSGIPSMPGYSLGGSGNTRVVRELGRFVAEPHHQYKITARLQSGDSAFRRMNPMVRAYISSDYLEGQGYMDVLVGGLLFAAIIGLIFLAVQECKPLLTRKSSSS